VYHRENANINRIKEVKCLYIYHSIPTDIKKSAIAMFIIELINKTVKDESHAQDLCEFLIHALVTLDQLTDKTENFHIIFLLKLSRFLGFGAHHVVDVLGVRITSSENEYALTKFITASFTDTVMVKNDQRREILELILKFYADHLGSFGEIKSIHVLREMLS
jgi:DNA repair protein RecO (recombination protein O)